MTLEDPVEYLIEGVRQTSIRSDGGFSEGLRSILRQNPGVIFVGEIRDSQTAELAFRASMTGRMVISTLHTRSALHSFNRLSDLGVCDGLIAENLVGVLAQRLVRKRCCGCCPLCADGGGYRGRAVVAEWLQVVPEVMDVVRNNRYDMHRCKEILRCRGMRFIEDELAELVASGVTSQDEAELLA
jgi:type II secretory ATPase GspE/PulE/Tfp pilus assembly ATPase PilB-like protein